MKSNPCSPPLTSASRADSRDHTTGSIGIVSSTAEDRTADTRTSIDDTGSQVASVVPVSTSRAKSQSAATDDVDQSVSPCTSSAGSSASPAPIRQTMIDAVAPSSTHPSVHVSKHDSTDTKDLCAVPSIVAAEELSPRPSHQHHGIPQYRVLSASSEHEEVEAEVQAIDHTATRDLQNDPRSRSTSESRPQRPSSTTSGVVVARCARGNLHAVTPFGRPVDVEGNVDRKTLTPSPMPEGGPTAAPTARDGATHRPTAQQPQSYMQPTVHAHAPKVSGGKSSPSPGIHTSRSHTPVPDMEGGARIQNPEPHPQTQTVPRSVTEYLMLGSDGGGHRTTPAPVPTTTTTTAAAAARLVSGMGPSLRPETTAPSTAKIYHYKSLAYNKAQLDQEVRDLREELAHVIGKGIPHGPTYHPSSISGGSSKVVPQHTTLKTGEGKMISTGVITFPVSSSSLGDQEANVVPSTGLIQNEHEGRPEEDGLGGSVVDAERSDASLVPSRSLALDAQARLRLGEYERQVEQEVLRREQLKEELKREQQLVLALQTRVQENAEKEQHVLSLRCEEAVLRESLLRSKKVLGPGKRIFASDVPGHKDVNAEIESLSTQFETLRILTEADRAEAAVRRLDRDVVMEQSKLEGLRNEIEDLSQKTRNSGESSKSPRTLERFTRAMTARGTSPSSGLPIPVEVTELLRQISQLEQELSRGDAQAFTAQLHAQKQQLEEIRRKYDTEDEALERECAEVQEIIRNITGTEDDIIILRQQLTNELRALELAINAKTVRVDGCVHPEECRGQHVAYFMELSNRVHEVLSEWVKIQQETSNLIEDATMRGIATTARGPFAGCKDKTAMLLSQYEKDAAHLRALIKALELRREELRREAAATRAQQVQCSAEKSPRNPQENKYGRTKSFGK